MFNLLLIILNFNLLLSISYVLGDISTPVCNILYSTSRLSIFFGVKNVTNSNFLAKS